MARLVPLWTTGLPANRPWSRTPTSTAKMTASAARMTAGSSGVAPEEPCVSTWTSTPAAFAGGGELVGGHVGVRDAGRAGADDDDAAPCGRRGGRGRGRRGGAGAAAGGRRLGGDDLVDQRARSPRPDVAARSDATNSGRTSARASAVSSVRWSASPCAGAAMRKTRSAGPSGAPKSTFGRQPGEAERGLGDRLRAAVRDGDAAGQAGRRPAPRGPWRRRAAPSALGGPAGGGDQFGQPADDGALVGAEVGVERDQVGGDQCGHGDLSRGVSGRPGRRPGRGCRAAWRCSGGAGADRR